jgi:outer membrane protein OmpA-like peptidoglycan-associated protein
MLMRWWHTAISAALISQLAWALAACGGSQSATSPTIVVDGASILIVDDADGTTPVEIPFEVDSHVLKDESHAPLSVLANFVRDRDDYKLIEVHGHSDERGSEAYNVQLSQRRAESVIDYLVGVGVERSRLRAKGFGSSRPAVHGSGESAWSRNRRVEFVIVEADES